MDVTKRVTIFFEVLHLLHRLITNDLREEQFEKRPWNNQK